MRDSVQEDSILLDLIGEDSTLLDMVVNDDIQVKKEERNRTQKRIKEKSWKEHIP